MKPSEHMARASDDDIVKTLEAGKWSPMTQHLLETEAKKRGLTWKKPNA